MLASEDPFFAEWKEIGVESLVCHLCHREKMNTNTYGNEPGPFAIKKRSPQAVESPNERDGPTAVDRVVNENGEGSMIVQKSNTAHRSERASHTTIQASLIVTMTLAIVSLKIRLQRRDKNVGRGLPKIYQPRHQRQRNRVQQLALLVPTKRKKESANREPNVEGMLDSLISCNGEYKPGRAFPKGNQVPYHEWHGSGSAMNAQNRMVLCAVSTPSATRDLLSDCIPCDDEMVQV